VKGPAQLSAVLLSSLVVFSLSANAQSIAWSRVSTPYSGAIIQMMIDQAGDIFAVDQFSGLYRSSDNGVSWISANSGLDPEYLNSMVFDSSGTIYAGSSTSGVYKSTDRGNSWSSTSWSTGVNAVLALPGGSVYAAGTSIVIHSGDGGRTWDTSRVVSDVENVLSLAYDESGNLYAGLEAYAPRYGTPYGGGIYSSSDGGKTWLRLGMYQSSVPSIVTDTSGTIFIIVGGNIFTGSPGSSVWTASFSGLADAGSPILLSQSPLGIMALMQFGVYVYDAVHTTWKQITPTVSGSTVTQACVNKNGVAYAGTERDGVFRYDSSSAAWYQCGVTSSGATSIAFDASGKMYVGTQSGIYCPAPVRGAWIRASAGLDRPAVYSIKQSTFSSRLFACTSGGLFYTTNGGEYWVPSLAMNTYDFVQLSTLDIFAATAGGIQVSDDGGSVWNPLEEVGLPVTAIYSVLLAGGQIFASASNDGLFVSTDQGNYWEEEGINTPLIFSHVSVVGSDMLNHLYAGTDGQGVYVSNDYGQSWSQLEQMDSSRISCLLLNLPAQIGSNGEIKWNKLFIGTLDAGVFVSTDMGSTWSACNNGLPIAAVNGLVAADSAGYIYAATDSGIYRTDGPITGVAGRVPTPSDFSLEQNFPNPFNPSTVISYKLSAVSDVSLKVYDVIGREVRTLVNARQNPGIHSVKFDARKLPSGVYFYRLQAGEFTSTKKMVLAK